MLSTCQVDFASFGLFLGRYVAGRTIYWLIHHCFLLIRPLCSLALEERINLHL